MRNEEGEIVGIHGITRDITEKKIAEKALKKSELKLKTIINAIPDLLFHLDKAGKFIDFYQQRHIQQLIMTPDEFIGKSIHDVFDDSIARGMQEAINEAMVKGESVFNYEIERKEVEYYQAKYAKLTNDELLAVVINLSGLKKSELRLKKYTEELLSLNADKDRFLSVLSHDLKSPFNSLLGFSELLLKNYDTYDANKIKGQIKLIHDIAFKAYDMLEDLLMWSSSQSGKLPFNPEHFVFSDLCSTVRASVDNMAKTKNISIDCIGEENLVVYADKNMLSTILRNLLSNAIKFSYKNTERKEQGIRIVVADEGIGISIGDQKNLWDTGKLHSASGTQGESGTGFGLLICKEFVEKHGGEIWMESGLEKGSNFMFFLPG